MSMSSPNSAPQSLLQRLFKLQEHGTTVRTELIAGVTTFLTMVLHYLFVNPQILAAAHKWILKQCLLLPA